MGRGGFFTIIKISYKHFLSFTFLISLISRCQSQNTQSLCPERRLSMSATQNVYVWDRDCLCPKHNMSISKKTIRCSYMSLHVRLMQHSFYGWKTQSQLICINISLHVTSLSYLNFKAAIWHFMYIMKVARESRPK